MFFMLCARLPGYRGVLRSRLQAAQQEGGGTQSRPSPAGRPSGRYERSSAMANNPRTAESSPPVTGASLVALNAQLGGNWFTYRKVRPGA